MNLLRFTRSEIKAMQMGIVILIASVVLFAYLANTTILPALKNLKLQYTECTVVHSDLIYIPPENPMGERCSSDKLPFICLQVFVTFSLIPIPDDVLKRKYKMNSKGYVFDINVESSHPFIGESQMKLQQKPKFLSHFGNDRLRGIPPSQQDQPPAYRALLHIDNSQSNMQTKCTLQPPCESDYHLLLQKMQTLQWRLGRQGKTFPCLYDLQNTKDVLLNRRYDWWSVYHSLFWPFMLMTQGFAIIVLIYCCIGRLKSAPSSSSEKSGIPKTQSQFSRDKNTTLRQNRPAKVGLNKFSSAA